MLLLAIAHDNMMCLLSWLLVYYRKINLLKTNKITGKGIGMKLFQTSAYVFLDIVFLGKHS